MIWRGVSAYRAVEKVRPFLGAGFFLSAARSKMIRCGFFFLDIVQGKGYRRDNLLRALYGAICGEITEEEKHGDAR